MSEITAVPLRPIKPGVLTTLWVGIAIALAVAVVWSWTSTRAQVAAAQPPEAFLAENGKRKGVVTTPSGLQYEVLKAGTGPHPGPQDIALIDYEGRLTSGEVFDASARNGGPVPLQVSGVVPGFSEALQLMSRDAKYRVWLPPQLGYGAQGAGPIPPNAVIVFDITLHAFQAMPAGMGAMGAAPPM
ncbi:MAG: FKBP-type peptidyl-prolyl cis-trans isomerase [Sphingomonas fennica]